MNNNRWCLSEHEQNANVIWLIAKLAMFVLLKVLNWMILLIFWW